MLQIRACLSTALGTNLDNLTRCPLETDGKPCFSQTMERMGQDAAEQRSSMTRELLNRGAQLTRNLGCGVEHSQPSPNSVATEVLGGQYSFENVFGFELFDTTFSLTRLARKEGADGKWHLVIGKYKDGRENPLDPLLYLLESLRQQMWIGKGPYCCFDDELEACADKELMLKLWVRTRAEPGVQWKQDRPPACLAEFMPDLTDDSYLLRQGL